jgi:hypothetical protein
MIFSLFAPFRKMAELYRQPGYNSNAMTSWIDKIRDELADAESAREAGNEGRARVCARRAAGIAAREWLTRRGVPVRNASAYQALQNLAEFPGLAPDLRQAAIHLTMRVTEAFALPGNIDLIEEAQFLVKGLGIPS